MRSRWLVLVALTMTACQGLAADVPPSSLTTTAVDRACPSGREDVDASPTGSLVVGYPDEPVAWLPALSGDVASVDLASLWGLPLFDFDADGQLRPRLLREAVVLGSGGGGWQVRLILCPGSWSDGKPVVAEDVVATIDAVAGTDGPLRSPIVAAVVDGPDVVVTFDAPTGRWQHALADLGTMLPAHVLATGGLEAWGQDVPVAGGPFRLVQVEPGLQATFEANEGSVLGQPATASLVVQVVPRFELALGLLESGDLDIALGHLALEAQARIDEADGLSGAIGRTGTLLTWQWQEDAAVTDNDVRALVHGTFNLTPFAEALLDGQGRITRSFVADQPGPVAPARARVDELPELVVAAPRWHESTGLLARAVRDGFERLGGTMRTTTDEADELLQTPLGDAQVRIRRLGPWPALSDLAGPGAVGVGAELWNADHAPSASDGAVAAGLAALEALAVEVPLVEVAIAHAWRDDVQGVQASGWPGIGFVSASDWTSGP